MKKTDKRSRFASFLFLFALHSMLQTPTQAMGPEDMEIDGSYSKTQLAKKVELEIEEEITSRFEKALQRYHTSDDELDLVEALWRVNYLHFCPQIRCWNVMMQTRNKNPVIYIRAYTLFQKYNPVLLQQKLQELQGETTQAH